VLVAYTLLITYYYVVEFIVLLQFVSGSITLYPLPWFIVIAFLFWFLALLFVFVRAHYYWYDITYWWLHAWPGKITYLPLVLLLRDLTLFIGFYSLLLFLHCVLLVTLFDKVILVYWLVVLTSLFTWYCDHDIITDLISTVLTDCYCGKNSGSFDRLCFRHVLIHCHVQPCTGSFIVWLRFVCATWFGWWLCIGILCCVITAVSHYIVYPQQYYYILLIRHVLLLLLFLIYSIGLLLVVLCITLL